MKPGQLPPNAFFTISSMHSVYQVTPEGKGATLVLDRSGGHVRQMLDFAKEPDLDVHPLDKDAIEALKTNRDFTGTIPS